MGERLCVYADKETASALKAIKERLDDDFNLSDFLKEHIIAYANKMSKKKADLVYIRSKILDYQEQLEKIQKRIDGFKETEEFVLRYISDENEKKEEMYKKDEELQIERFKTFKATMIELYDIPKRNINKIAKEFTDQWADEESRKDMQEFLSSKGYKLKLEEEITQ